jgi:phosphoesterase RecJ-like protein
MKQIIQTLNRNKRFLISTHVNPDPDALCSELALAEYLRSIGKIVWVINNEDVPRRYRFLPGISRIRRYRKNLKEDYDVAIIVDCGELERIGQVKSLLQRDTLIINIDHHITNNKFGKCNLVQPKASSTAEVLYELLTKAKCRFTKNLARCLYIGIMTDTGSFRHENTSARTHAITAELMKYNVAPHRVYQKFYETISFKDIKEFADVIRRFDMHFGGRVASIELTKKVLSKFSGDFDLRDTIFKFLRSIKGIKVVVICTEIKQGETRINLRSSEKFNVAKLAAHFNGGGHHRASGCMIDKNISQAHRIVINKIRAQL